MEKLFYKIQYKLTVKEINEYADSIEDKTDIDCKVCDWIDTFKCMYSSRAFGTVLFNRFPLCCRIDNQRGEWSRDGSRIRLRRVLQVAERMCLGFQRMETES